MIVFSDSGESMFLTHYDFEGQELTFRTSRVPQREQKEKVQILENNMVHTSLYHFPIQHLQKFINETNN